MPSKFRTISFRLPSKHIIWQTEVSAHPKSSSSLFKKVHWLWRGVVGYCSFLFFSVKVSFCNSIDRTHKWRPINYSFVFILIILTSLVSTNKIQKNFCSKVRLVRMNVIYFIIRALRCRFSRPRGLKAMGTYHEFFQ